MTEAEARDWLRATFGTLAEDRLAAFVAILLEEAARQSLVARSTFDQVWSRHIVDSAQLVALAPAEGVWLDIGSGGGLPGIVVAILRNAPVFLVEPRRKRADFMRSAIASLGLAHADVVQASVQTLAEPAVIISARAVAPIDQLFGWTRQLVSRETVYLLPRGENAALDLAIARRAWQGAFHVKQSLTDPNAGIVLASGVRPL